MYTAIAQTRNIYITVSSLLLDTTSREKRFINIRSFYILLLPIVRLSISKDTIISCLHYSCPLNEFSDIKRFRSHLLEFLTPRLRPKTNTVLSPQGWDDAIVRW